MPTHAHDVAPPGFTSLADKGSYMRPATFALSGRMRRIARCAVSVVLAYALMPTGVAHAQAITRLVAITGADVGDCSVDPCATIQFAHTVAAPGDTILVSPGTTGPSGSREEQPDVARLRGGDDDHRLRRRFQWRNDIHDRGVHDHRAGKRAMHSRSTVPNEARANGQ